MQVTGISLNEFRALTGKISVRYGGNVKIDPNARELSGNRFRARLAARDSRGQGARRSWSGRRGPWACWHVYRDVMIEVFDLNEDARITTGLEVYRGRDDFENKFEATYWKNAGSMMEPVAFGQLCECS
jgi:hypothetical protein